MNHFGLHQGPVQRDIGSDAFLIHMRRVYPCMHARTHAHTRTHTQVPAVSMPMFIHMCMDMCIDMYGACPATQHPVHTGANINSTTQPCRHTGRGGTFKSR